MMLPIAVLEILDFLAVFQCLRQFIHTQQKPSPDIRIDVKGICATLAEARKRARRRVERFGFPVMIYEVDPFAGEKLIEELS